MKFVMIFQILDKIANASEITSEMHQHLAEILIKTCEFNAKKDLWQTTPYHTARCLKKFSRKYPVAEMDENNNSLIDYQDFIEISQSLSKS